VAADRECGTPSCAISRELWQYPLLLPAQSEEIQEDGDLLGHGHWFRDLQIQTHGAEMHH